MDRVSTRLWYALYNLLLYLGVVVCLPVWLFVRFLRGRYRGQFMERMGVLSPEIRARFGAPHRVGKHPVLPPDRKWPDRVLDRVGVKRDVSGFKHAHELRPLPIEIPERFAGETPRHHSFERAVEPAA